ncbi:hypothetical protein [Actinoplanes sp. NPDC051851]|uniref:hypothetical protein n=1 Tax=Actinoplanes sp. NPDC051851 TaxID=3154753 RepID=UPI0034288BAB
MWWILGSVGVGVAGIGIGIAVALVGARRRRRVPVTAEEKRVAARAAMQAIRKGDRRRRAGTRGGPGVPDRHSAAIAENAYYGDGSSFGDSGGASGGGGGGD